ncbi:glycosyltransferase family 4 protein [bacterium]|nr:glycosyltransferase family 4 protein [bacterium]
MANHLSGNAYSPIIAPIANHGELERQAKALNIPTLFIPMKSRFDISDAAHRLSEMANQHNANVIHTFGIRSNCLAWKIQTQSSCAWAARIPNRSYTDYDNPWVGRLSHWANNFFLKRADAIQIISPQLKEYYLESGFPIEKLELIPNGIDLERYQSNESKEDCKQALGIPPDAFVIGSVGRLAPIKGYDKLIKAFAQVHASLPSSHLVLIGDGPEKAALQLLAKQFRVEKAIHFTGFLGDIRPALWALDLYVCSSHSEGVPHTILEAMAAGVPVVSTRVGGVESIMTHNQHGVFLDGLDESNVANTILTVASDKDRMNEYARNAHENISANFSEELMVNKIIAMYDRITND